MYQPIKKSQRGYDVIFLKADSSHLKPVPLNPSTRKLLKGTICKEGHRPLLCDLVYEQDVAIKMWDGATLYADVFRPDDDREHPTILVYTIYGKIDPPNNYDVYPNEYPNGATMDKLTRSGLDSFEAPDPDYWVLNDYAMVVVDARGSTNSEGAMLFDSWDQGLDVRDCIDWAGEQKWSNGNVGMIGNSALATCQYYAAIHHPKHLKAIAPWEAFSDCYRDTYSRGGIPAVQFFSSGITKMLRVGPDGIEDVTAMVDTYPLFNEYWEKEKRVDFDNITIPAYIVASYSSSMHAYGTFRAFNRIKSGEKWLRVHNTQEWPDQYTPKYRDDLKKFYDYYLKGVDNGWNDTPRVRVSVLEETGPDTVDRPEEAFPLPRTEYKKLYLNGQDNSLSFTKPENEVPATYDVGEKKDGKIVFRHVFQKDTELTGYFRAHLFVSADSGNDMDLFVFASKEDSVGVPYKRLVIGCPFEGSSGRLRASHREIDLEKSEIYDCVYKNDHEDLIEPGQIIELDIAMWPLGMKWRKGEILVFTISVKDLQELELPLPPMPTRNQGIHTIYTGGKYSSYLEVPVV